MSEVWPARLAAWGGARGRARPRSGVEGPGAPGETGSRQRRCRLATAQARGAPGPAPESRVRGLRGGTGGVAAEPVGAARGLWPGSGVPLRGPGALGATFPASCHQGRPRPPEPGRGSALSAVPRGGNGEPPGGERGKVWSWGPSGARGAGAGRGWGVGTASSALGPKWPGRSLRRGGAGSARVFGNGTRAEFAKPRSGAARPERGPPAAAPLPLREPRLP